MKLSSIVHFREKFQRLESYFQTFSTAKNNNDIQKTLNDLRKSSFLTANNSNFQTRP